MNITPAILTQDKEFFLRLYNDLKFCQSLDIDICRPPFVQSKTVQISDILNELDYKSQDIGFHLMVEDPVTDLKLLNELNLKETLLRVYVHQESKLEELLDFDINFSIKLGVAVNLSSDLLDLEFYNRFFEVQLMSVEVGKQGGEFQPKVLEKVDKLRSMGYGGIISFDGGINLQTILNVKNVDRVSVGSYFQRSQNQKESYRMLLEKITL